MRERCTGRALAPCSRLCLASCDTENRSGLQDQRKAASGHQAACRAVPTTPPAAAPANPRRQARPAAPWGCSRQSRAQAANFCPSGARRANLLRRPAGGRLHQAASPPALIQERAGPPAQPAGRQGQLLAALLLRVLRWPGDWLGDRHFHHLVLGDYVHRTADWRARPCLPQQCWKALLLRAATASSAQKVLVYKSFPKCTHRLAISREAV